MENRVFVPHIQTALYSLQLNFDREELWCPASSVSSGLGNRTSVCPQSHIPVSVFIPQASLGAAKPLIQPSIWRCFP